MTAGTASAAGSVVDPDDTTTPASPVAGMLTGVGSDTSQHAVKVVADAYNATNPASKLFTYSATGGGTVSLADGSSITRPNGSGAGKTLLYNPSNPQISFARSSSAENTAEVAAGLQSFPFALDTLISVTSGNVASNAPANLTAAQLVSIYKCDVTTWNQVGGTSTATIAPKIPQSGSGTLTFFLAQLQAANGGVAVTPGTCVGTVQEHDPTDIANNPNAIAPFSEGRANLATAAGSLKLRNETGFRADRALYNVVRGSDVNSPAILAAFGTSGYFCSPAAKPFIEASGFKQLLVPSQGGVCGAPTQGATSNFTVAQVATTTAVTVASASTASGTAARVTARVSGSTAPAGTVTFFEGTTAVASNVPLASGQAVATPAAAPGSHTYRAVFTPAANSAFLGSEGTGSGAVTAATTAPTTKAVSKVKAKSAKSVVGKPVKLTVKVALQGSSAKATGKVVAKIGKKTVGKGSLKNGTAKVTLKKFTKPGKYKVTITWAGDANGASGKAKATVTVVKK